MNYSKYIIVSLLILLYSTVRGQTQLLKNYDFNKGGYCLIGMTSEGGPNKIVDSLGDFYTNDIAVLNAIKKEWTFTKPSPMYSCGYNYLVYIYRNGSELEKFHLNLSCNLIANEKAYFYFKEQQFRMFIKDFKQVYWLYRRQWYDRLSRK
jgi:hypothetical protein